MRLDLPTVPNLFPNLPNNKSHSLFKLCLWAVLGRESEMLGLNLTPCPSMLSLLSQAKHVCACMLWRRRKYTAHKLGARISQRALSKRQNCKRGVVTIIIFLRAPGRTYCPPPEAKAVFQLRDRAMASCSSLSSWGM